MKILRNPMVKQVRKPFFFPRIYCFLFLILFFASCKERARIDEKEIVAKPEDIAVKAEEMIQGTLKDILQNNKNISDSVQLKNAPAVYHLYNEHSFQPLWSEEGRFTSWGDSLFFFLDSVKNYGLFPQDYYHTKLEEKSS